LKERAKSLAEGVSESTAACMLAMVQCRDLVLIESRIAEPLGGLVAKLALALINKGLNSPADKFRIVSTKKKILLAITINIEHFTGYQVESSHGLVVARYWQLVRKIQII
jgi:hypothetical protein